MKIPLVAASILCVAIAGTQFGAASAADLDTDNSSSAAVAVPVTIDVHICTIDTPGTSGQSGIVEIRVGKSAPFAVMLDTGSVGLRVFPGAWERKPGSVALGSKKIATALAGREVKGIVGRATVTLNGVATALPVPFQYVNTTNPYIQQWTGRKIFGILGIGTGSGDLTNPLMAMPANLGLSWSVHFERNISDRIGRLGSLVLGGQAPPETIMVFQSPFVGKNINGALLWNDHASNGCWRFGVKPEWCGNTWFDSGFTKMRVKGRVFARLPQGANGLLRQGTRVEFAAPGSAYVGHRFVSGDQASRNYVRVLPKGAGVVNTGNSFYFDYTVTYNVALGKIYLSKS